MNGSAVWFVVPPLHCNNDPRPRRADCSQSSITLCKLRRARARQSLSSSSFEGQNTVQNSALSLLWFWSSWFWLLVAHLKCTHYCGDGGGRARTDFGAELRVIRAAVTTRSHGCSISARRTRAEGRKEGGKEGGPVLLRHHGEEGQLELSLSHSFRGNET